MLPCFVFSIAYYSVWNGTNAADNGELSQTHDVDGNQIEGEK